MRIIKVVVVGILGPVGTAAIIAGLADFTGLGLDQAVADSFGIAGVVIGVTLQVAQDIAALQLVFAVAQTQGIGVAELIAQLDVVLLIVKIIVQQVTVAAAFRAAEKGVELAGVEAVIQTVFGAALFTGQNSGRAAGGSFFGDDIDRTGNIAAAGQLAALGDLDLLDIFERDTVPVDKVAAHNAGHLDRLTVDKDVVTVGVQTTDLDGIVLVIAVNTAAAHVDTGAVAQQVGDTGITPGADVFAVDTFRSGDVSGRLCGRNDDLLHLVRWGGSPDRDCCQAQGQREFRNFMHSDLPLPHQIFTLFRISGISTS